MLTDLSDTAAVAVSVAAWTVLGFLSGFTVSRIPLHRLDHDNWLTRLRRWEDGGRWYDRHLAVRRWKDRLPELGGLFPGGTSTRRLVGRDDAAILRFAAETRRAEIVHWANLAAGPLFLLWCPPAIGAVMVAFGAVAHAPFVVIQRFNRGRLDELVARRQRRRPPTTT